MLSAELREFARSPGAYLDATGTDIVETDRYFARVGTHSRRGSMSLQDLLVDYANHPEGHARQIEKNREAFRKARA